MITTVKHGLFILTRQKLLKFELKGLPIDNYQFFSDCIKLNNTEFIVSTYTNGLYKFNVNGLITETLSEKDGMQNSNVRTCYLDHNQNL